jgi:hypothetical protein
LYTLQPGVVPAVNAASNGMFAVVPVMDVPPPWVYN